MKRRGFTWIELVVILAVIVILAAILLPLFARRRDEKRRTSCQNNVRQIANGLLRYVRDNDEFYPLVAVQGSLTYGWGDAVQPYIKGEHILQCPSEPSASSLQPNAPCYTDYWFNTRLSGKSHDEVDYLSRVLMLGDGSDGQDVTHARYSKSRLPLAWLKDTSMPPFRHLGGANYAFGDGHVKWLLPTQVSNAPPAKNAYSSSLLY